MKVQHLLQLDARARPLAFSDRYSGPGFLINACCLQNIPVFMSWIRYLSIVYYGFRLLERVQYSPDQTYNCKALEGCLRFEDSPIFKDMSLEGGLRDALALMVMIVVYKVLAYVCLRRV